MSGRTYVNGACQIGQAAPCGEVATHAIAVWSIADTAWGTNPRDGGVVLLCDRHSRSVAEWDA